MNNLLIIGDIMIDSYIYVEINKIANEAPIPVFSYSNKKNILGGCGNVLENMKVFNNNLHLITVIGNDENGNIIKNLTKNFTNINLILDYKRKTTTKNRIIADNKILLRYDNEDTFKIGKDIEEIIINKFNEIFDKIDLVVFSDYNKGVLTEKICKHIIEKCNKFNKVTVGDLKYNFEFYKNITITKPNLLEAKLYTKLKNIEDIHNYIIKTIKCKYSIVTLGKDGISLYDNNKLFETIYESNEVVDVTGAGDIVISVLCSLYFNKDIKTILQIATYLGTLSVKKIGTYELTHEDILNSYKWIKNKYFTDDIIYHLKNSNLKIIFTNGCFDILHTGHLNYLESAKKLGDILIVGINSDNSVKKLKGENRPINNLEDRILFLSKLDFIDFIVSFDEDTPFNIIKKIEPDILIKGGDYKVEDIIGREFAKETMVLPFVDGKSTTNILNNINIIN